MATRYLGEKKQLINFFLAKKWKTDENIGQVSVRATTPTGTIINWYQQKGTIQIQGIPDPNIEQEINDFINSGLDIDIYSSVLKNDNIYVVHGHDKHAKTELENILMKWGLKPKATIDQSSSGGTIIETLMRDLDTCNFGIALLTPDDFGYAKKDGANNIKPRARQNVILELGIMVGKLGRKNVLVIRKSDIEEPSDLNGVIYKGYAESIDEIKYEIMQELEAAGIKINSK